MVEIKNRIYLEIPIEGEQIFEIATILEVFSHDYHLSEVLLHHCDQEEKEGKEEYFCYFFLKLALYSALTLSCKILKTLS